MNGSDKFFENYYQEAYHLWECLASEKSDVAIRNSVKLCSIYSCFEIHGEPWDVKEGGGTAYIKRSTGVVLPSSKESLLLLGLIKLATQPEEAWMVN